MKIYLFTNQFPFGKGEIFIKDELETSTSSQEEINICPLEYKKNETDNEYKNLILSPRFKPYDWAIVLCNCVLCLPLLREIKFLVCSKKIHLNTLKRALVFWILANVKRRKIELIIKQDNNKDDQIVCYSYWATTTALAITLIKRNRKILGISRAHGIDLYETRHRYEYLPFRYEIYTKLDKLFLISKSGEKYIKTHYFFSSKIKSEVSKLGTQDYGINKENEYSKLVLVSCSSVIEIKRVHLILDCLSTINNIKIEWHHFGTGELFRDLENRVKKSKNRNLTCNLWGFQKKDTIMNFYRHNKIDLFINVSTTEGLPVSMMEAISFGIPIIATDVGGTNEIVINNITGWLIDKDKVESELKDALVTYYWLSKSEKTKIRNSTRKFWEENFNSKCNYYNFYEDIKELVHEKIEDI
ncbi:hypothetical protein B5E64_10745 [Drancourtella sp. An12]|uniref:glycosyltransferase n=1 Tax=Drancourtella sp. An12 TaxID=1965548 RepID=UPI000B37A0F5|nr:glycosyltransferase [Drancourtella sp. An12]OUQ45171.1 hypothetical protein B5E64_10745 [Drancourtella sp. An12]